MKEVSNIKEQIITGLKEYQKSYGDLFIGDIWVDLEISNGEGYGEGIFVQVLLDEPIESVELNYYVYPYRNYIDEEGSLTSDWANTIITPFQIFPEDF